MGADITALVDICSTYITQLFDVAIMEIDNHLLTDIGSTILSLLLQVFACR